MNYDLQAWGMALAVFAAITGPFAAGAVWLARYSKTGDRGALKRAVLLGAVAPLLVMAGIYGWLYWEMRRIEKETVYQSVQP